MLVSMEPTREQNNGARLAQQDETLGASGVAKNLRSQPFLALSGLGLAVASFKTALRKIKRAAALNVFKLPKMPKYLRNNYVKYPAGLFVLLAVVRRIRLAINQ